MSVGVGVYSLFATPNPGDKVYTVTLSGSLVTHAALRSASTNHICEASII